MSVLSSKEMRLFSRQINCAEVGISKQEILKQSKVAVIGLCGIGVTTSRLLCTTGYGKVIMVSDSLVNEDALPSMTYLGWGDVGKHRSIALYDKMSMLHSDVIEKVDIFTTLPSPANTEKLFAGCNAVVDTCRSYESSISIMDYADKHNIPVLIAFGKGWLGFIGTYFGKNRDKLRERIEQAYKNDELCMCRQFCFGFLNSAIGSITAGALTRLLWGMKKEEAQLTEYDFRIGKISNLLGDEIKLS
jgi:adenylyltransferase/sulfurtransferase